MKQFVPKDKLVRSGQGWAQGLTPTSIRLIGLAEILGAAGLILPAVTHIAPILVPLAAIGLALVMVGAAIVHARRKEPTWCCSRWPSSLPGAGSVHTLSRPRRRAEHCARRLACLRSAHPDRAARSRDATGGQEISCERRQSGANLVEAHAPPTEQTRVNEVSLRTALIGGRVA
jgi:hypothetical protein